MPRTHVVLGGGGALGAYQAGALLGLAEGGVLPDALHGCSAGALNAAFLAARPTAARAADLAAWWADPGTHGVLVPPWRARLTGLAAAVAGRSDGILDARPLRALVAAQVPAHDLSELGVPLTVTTTCLDCADAVHHATGPVADVLVASCALPGLFPPVVLPDGHAHVDGGVLAGVPLAPALAAAGPDDRVLVLDCGLAPVTAVGGACAALPGLRGDGCGLPVPVGTPAYVAPVESSRGALDVVLRAFTVARAAANRASTLPGLDDPRVSVLPHVADAWAAGLLPALPRGPRDVTRTPDLVRAGRAAAAAWLRADRRGAVVPLQP